MQLNFFHQNALGQARGNKLFCHGIVIIGGVMLAIPFVKKTISVIRNIRLDFKRLKTIGEMNHKFAFISNIGLFRPI